ncbi:hypothetical protein BDV95DRAFT_586351 [Massariosphaeria phaeospora]|uniref:Rhodopsin domain-containing protein n=1 Tax=Massariosphaeria phaeospora TaxID=100035 RepID=A0A7C8I1D8_9PLEO|nr:hypothetical protein BDV95DRAFT_586351 [Massariosphaeria phaeospora]
MAIPDYLLKMPAATPPPGVQSNFVDPETNGEPARVVSICFTAAAVLMVALRLYARTTLPKGQRLGWDDVTCVMALVGSIANMVSVLLLMDVGFGRHLWDVRALDLTPQVLLLYAGLDVSYTIAAFFTKLSLLLMYHRLFQVISTSRWLIYAGVGLITCTVVPNLTCSVLRVKRCIPAEKMAGDPYCSNWTVNVVMLTSGTFNTVADLLILFIPIQRVLKLQSIAQARVGLLLIFSVGLIACLSSCVRVIVVGVNRNTIDGFWNAARSAPYMITELNLGIICACVVLMRTLFRKATRAVRSRSGFFIFGKKDDSQIDLCERSEPSLKQSVRSHQEESADDVLQRIIVR